MGNLDSKFKFLLIIIGVSFFSCSESNSLSFIITRDNPPFWDVYDKSRGYLGGSYCFFKNGTCYYYSYNKQGERSEFFKGGIVVPQTWQLKGDSIISIQGVDIKVLGYSIDTIKLKNTETSSNTLLVRGERS